MDEDVLYGPQHLRQAINIVWDVDLPGVEGVCAFATAPFWERERKWKWRARLEGLFDQHPFLNGCWSETTSAWTISCPLVKDVEIHIDTMGKWWFLGRNASAWDDHVRAKLRLEPIYYRLWRECREKINECNFDTDGFE